MRLEVQTFQENFKRNKQLNKLLVNGKLIQLN
jgi:hypothetical protein